MEAFGCVSVSLCSTIRVDLIKRLVLLHSGLSVIDYTRDYTCCNTFLHGDKALRRWNISRLAHTFNYDSFTVVSALQVSGFASLIENQHRSPALLRTNGFSRVRFCRDRPDMFYARESHFRRSPHCHSCPADAITWCPRREGRNGKKIVTQWSCARVTFPPGFSLTWHRIGVNQAASALARGSRKTGGCPVRYRRFYTRLVSAPGLGRDSRYRWKTLRKTCIPRLRSILAFAMRRALYSKRKCAISEYMGDFVITSWSRRDQSRARARAAAHAINYHRIF